MGSPFGRLAVIVDTRSGRRILDELPEIERQLRAKALEYRIVEAGGLDDVTRQARGGLEAGDRFLVAVGGDDTVDAVVNGMIEDDAPVAEDAVLGVIPAGAECDFLRTFGLPRDTARAVGMLAGDRVFPLDAVKATFATAEGERSTYFAGVARVGFGGAVVARSSRLPTALGRGRHFLGFWLSLARSKAVGLRVRAGEKEFEGPGREVVVGNCQYTAGGQRVSPRSWPSDGLLDVLVMTGPRSDSFTMLPVIYRGEHVPHANITELKGRTVRVEADRPLRVEAGGRPLGTTPATFELIRLPIRLKT